MIGPSYKENRRLISGEGGGEEKKQDEKAKRKRNGQLISEKSAKALVVGQPVAGE